jgi:hypothetical protein
MLLLKCELRLLPLGKAGTSKLVKHSHSSDLCAFANKHFTWSGCSRLGTVLRPPLAAGALPPGRETSGICSFQFLGRVTHFLCVRNGSHLSAQVGRSLFRVGASSRVHPASGGWVSWFRSVGRTPWSPERGPSRPRVSRLGSGPAVGGSQAPLSLSAAY